MTGFGAVDRRKARIDRRLLKLGTILGSSAAMAAMLVPALARAGDLPGGFNLEAPLLLHTPFAALGFTPAPAGPAPQDLTVRPTLRRATAMSGGDVSVSYGNVGTTADYTPAISVTSSGNATIVAGNVTTAGKYSAGVMVNAGGAISITAGDISTSGYASPGVSAIAVGDINISTGSVSMGGAISTAGIRAAIYANSSGGDVNIVANGDVTANGSLFSRGIEAIGHNITITAGNVNAGPVGIYAHGYGAGAAVDLTLNGNVTSYGRVANGATAISAGTVSINSTGLITTTGNAAGGLVEAGHGLGGYGQGDVSINSQGQIKLLGAAPSNGIVGVSYAGNVSISAATIDVYTGRSTGIEAQASSGQATVVANNIYLNSTETTGIGVRAGSADITLSGTIQAGQGVQTTAGIYAIAYSGDLQIHNNGQISLGLIATGIKAYATGNITIDGQGSISAGAKDSYGILAASPGGAISISQSSIVSNGYGVQAVASNPSSFTSNPAHSISINVGSLQTTGTGVTSTGIAAFDYNIGAPVSINAGAVSTVGDYADAINVVAQSGSITITGGDITTRGNHAMGISTYRESNDNITLNAITTTGSYHATGIQILSTGQPGVVNVNIGSISTAGYNSPGAVVAYSGIANINIGKISTLGNKSTGLYIKGENNIYANLGAVSTVGDVSYGVLASSGYGAVSITETGGVATQGQGSIGVLAEAPYGAVDLTLTGAISTKGDNSPGAVAISNGASVNVEAGAITTSGAGSSALVAYALGGSATVNITSASTAGIKSSGVFVDGLRGATINAGTVSTTGDVSNGVIVRAGGYGVVGNATVNVTSVSTTGRESAGIDALVEGVSASNPSQASAISITAGSITTTGLDSPGIVAMNGYGAISIQASNISTQGSESTGVIAMAAGDINIQAGAISTGAADAVYASGSGTLTFNVSGKVAAAGGSGIVSINPTGPTDITVTSGGGISGGQDGIQIQTATGQVTIANAGTIAGGTGYAIDVMGVMNNGVAPTPIAGAVIDNSGVISGAVYLSAANNTLSNEGAFNASKTSVFGAGSSFTNTGTVNVSGQVAFQGLSSFQNNGGLVDLRGGPAGTTFTLAGNYVASGNARLGLSLSDELVVQGQASGATQILLGASPATATMFAARPLVQMGAWSTATFTLANADVGLVHYSLTENGGGASNGPLRSAAAAAPLTYDLSASAGQPVYATLKLEESGQTAWRQSADAWSAHLAAMRGDAWGADSASGSGRIWAQVYRSTSDRDGHADASYGQVSTAYEQTDVGVQVGGDLMRRAMGLCQVVWGLTGGYDNSSINGKDNISQSNIDTLNIGGYASLFSAHGVFANALVKYDHNQISTSNAAAGYSVDLTGNSVGFQVELGQRFGDDRFDFEPLVSLNYVHTSLDNVSILNQSLAFNDDDGLSAKFGGRVSTKRWVGSTAAVFYAGASVVDDFSGDEKASFTSGALSQGVSAKGTGVYGQGVIGVSAHTSFGLSLYAEGNGDFGGDYNGSGFRIGGRFNF